MFPQGGAGIREQNLPEMESCRFDATVPFEFNLMTTTESTIEIATPTGPMRTLVCSPAGSGKYPGLILFSEIFQLTGAIQRMVAFVAGHGYLTIAPEIYHDLTPPGTVFPYDQAGSEKGRAMKGSKELKSYDADARASIDYLKTHPTCSGNIGAIGLCTGGHLAFRAAMNPEIRAAACLYATDLHSHSLGKGASDDSLQRTAEIKGELLHIWGRQDPNIPFEGRSLIRARLEEASVDYQWIEVNANHAFFRDEGPRRDPALIRLCYGFIFDLFHRRLT
jgi:carboxymethylenebutenolidase